MTYLWENYDENKKFYVKIDNNKDTPYAGSLSPYQEIGKNDFFGISVNPVLRFWHIFQYLYRNFDKKTIEDLGPLHEVENVLFHYLAMLDRKSGVHLSSLSEWQLHNELLDGCFGQTAERLYSSLSDMDKRWMLIFLGRHQRMQGRDCIFFEALATFFKNSKVYYHTPEKKYLICVPFCGSEYNKNLMDLLMILFWPLGVDNDIFWDSHFGIIGRDDTMKIDSFVIY